MEKDLNLFALIDIGSHSIKMNIGSIKDKKVELVENLWIPVNIGKDIFVKGNISSQTINNIINILKKFQIIINSYKISNIKAITSTSIREANNYDVLIERIKNFCGIEVKIIDPTEEAEFLFSSINNIFNSFKNYKKNNTLIFYLGGSSSHIILLKEGKIIYSEYHRIGTVKLLKDIELYNKTYLPTLKPFSVGLMNSLKNFPEVKKIDVFIGMNDDLLIFLKNYFKNNLKDNVFILSKKTIEELSKEFENNSIDFIKDKYKIDENIILTTKISILMLYNFFILTDSKDIFIPNISSSTSFLENILIKKYSFKTDKYLKENIISSAIAMARKYNYDEDHSLHVKKLSLKIFDQLKDIYGFKEEEKLYLEVASILHDIGAFVSASNHHKHSFQLIHSSEILGLNSEDMKIIGLIARYHRKSPPKPSHTQYHSLSLESRLLVSKLSSILRIADGLDNSHMQIVEDLNFNFYEEYVELLIKIKNNQIEFFPGIEKALKKKQDLFESFFGLPLKLGRML